MGKKITAYKGFNKDMTCLDFQYKVGETYKHKGRVKACQSGFHACEFPLDVFYYYEPYKAIYCEVEQSGEIEKHEDDSKIASAKITITAELTLHQFIGRAVQYIIDRATSKKSNTGYRSAASNTGDYSAASNTGNQSAASNTGNYSAASNTGNRSAASNTGNYSAASNTGYQSAASNTGDYSAASNTGNQSAASNTGDYSAASNTGNQSAASNTGNQSAASNTGNYSAASNTGNQSAASVGGKNSVAIASGVGSKAKASKGSAIVLCEYDDDCNLVKIHSAIAGKKKIKPDTWYTAKGGKLVECEE